MVSLPINIFQKKEKSTYLGFRGCSSCNIWSSCGCLNTIMGKSHAHCRRQQWDPCSASRCRVLLKLLLWVLWGLDLELPSSKESSTHNGDVFSNTISQIQDSYGQEVLPKFKLQDWLQKSLSQKPSSHMGTFWLSKWRQHYPFWWYSIPSYVEYAGNLYYFSKVLEPIFSSTWKLSKRCNYPMIMWMVVC